MIEPAWMLGAGLIGGLTAHFLGLTASECRKIAKTMNPPPEPKGNYIDDSPN